MVIIYYDSIESTNELFDMTDTLRSSTLRLRRPVVRDAAITRPKQAAVTTVRASEASESSERSLRSDALLQGHSHISILHNGETYQLRATRLGKLILTK
ncbi:hemin uptake protein HemP [Caballeronia choica]|jgi:hemin uptake protein HemP|uniref:Hemin uptake protein HemP n=2 Tax=Caballeronia choica TaxID=326476 RepID=A0A158KLQ5_9BURK|nr:hemin uptake protein HemP [Caballeronia choica]